MRNEVKWNDVIAGRTSERRVKNDGEKSEVSRIELIWTCLSPGKAGFQNRANASFSECCNRASKHVVGGWVVSKSNNMAFRKQDREEGPICLRAKPSFGNSAARKKSRRSLRQILSLSGAGDFGNDYLNEVTGISSTTEKTEIENHWLKTHWTTLDHVVFLDWPLILGNRSASQDCRTKGKAKASCPEKYSV